MGRESQRGIGRCERFYFTPAQAARTLLRMSYQSPELRVPGLSLELASGVVSECFGGRITAVQGVRPLAGGMINRVEEWQLSGPPHRVVAKMNHDAEHRAGLRQEEASLRWCRTTTRLPVPEVYGLMEREVDGKAVACLLMERLPGRNLIDAKLTPAGRAKVGQQMAQHLALLHTTVGERYGHLCEPGQAHWIDWFAPRLESNVVAARERLSAEQRHIAERLLADLPQWLAGASVPSAVHGDIWGANLIVDDRDPDAPVLSGFVDGGGLLADVDYELAYICCFSRAGWEAFYEAYAEHHRPRPGHERRWRAYWLNTVLLHVWMFGDEYLPRCRELLAEISGMR